MTTIDGFQPPSALTRGRGLEYFKVAWNILEGLIAVVSGIIAEAFRWWVLESTARADYCAVQGAGIVC
jgi:hypothetical protein